MDRHIGPLLRWTRVAMLAAVAPVSALVAHVSADGLLPGWPALIVLYVICCGTAGTLLGRPASTLRVVVLLMAGQTFIHGALTSLSGHRGDPPPTRVTPSPDVMTLAMIVARTNGHLLRLTRNRELPPPIAVTERGRTLGTQLARRGPPVPVVAF